MLRTFNHERAVATKERKASLVANCVDRSAKVDSMMNDLRTTRVESSQVLADNLTECLQKIRASVSGLSVWRRSSSQRSDKRCGHTLHSDHHCQVCDADIVRNCNANFRIPDLMRLCRLHFLNPQFS